VNENPFKAPQNGSARKDRRLGKCIEQLDYKRKDWLMLGIGLFVIAPLFHFLFYC
jgi:hypothetical protein